MATTTDQVPGAIGAGELKLTPPDPVPVVQPEKAAGLVPVGEEQKSKLQVLSLIHI